MPHVEVNGTSLFYERTGDGPPLVFLHGLGGHGDVWADQAARFADRHTCVRYDRRGHSRSGHGDGPITHALHADDAAGLIEALGLAPCVVVASSLGAAITVDLVLRNRHLVRAAVLSEPPLFAIDADAGQAVMADIRPVVEEAMGSGGPEAFIDAFYSVMCPGLWATIDEAQKDRYRANAGIGLEDLQSPPLSVTSDDLSSIDIPCLLYTSPSPRDVEESRMPSSA